MTSLTVSANDVEFVSIDGGEPITKRCIKCHTIKDTSLFYRKSGAKDNLQNECKACSNKAKTIRVRSKEGVVRKIYDTQKASSRERGHPPPSYSKQELVDWCLKQDVFHTLYDRWVSSNYDKWKVPSVDRINDYKGYSFDNIQLMSFYENYKKAHMDAVEGRNNKQSIPVICYSIDGEFIKEYYSINQASRELSIKSSDIGAVCAKTKLKRKRRDGSIAYCTPKTAGGYVWRFKAEVKE